MFLNTSQIYALLGGVTSTFANLDKRVDAKVFQEALPLVGDNLHDAYASNAAATKHFATIGQKVADVLKTDAFKSGGDSDALQAALHNALGDLGDVSIAQGTGTNVGNPQFTFTSHKTYQALAGSVESSLGLPGLGLDVQGQQTSTTLAYDMSLTMGLDGAGKNTFYVDGTTDQISLGIGAAATGNSTGTAVLAHAPYIADFRPSATGAPTLLAGTVALDLNGPAKIRTAAAGATDVVARLTGDAGIHADLTGNAGAAAVPDLHTQLDVGWHFASTLLNGTAANAANFGDRPDVHFNEVQVNYSTFLSETLGPTFHKLDTILGPVAGVIHALNTQIPVLHDLGINATLATFIEQFGGASAAGFAGKVSAFDSALQFMKTLDSASNAGNVDLGSVTLTSAQDIRAAKFNLATLDLGTAVNHLAPASVVGDLQAAAGASFTFPILDGTTNSPFAYLLGQDATVFLADLPTLTAGFHFEQFFPILGPLGVKLKGEFGIAADLDFGFNQHGFFLDDHNSTGTDLPEVMINASLTAAAELNLLLARAGVGGGLFADVDLDFRDPTPLERGISFSDLDKMISSGRIFNASGQVEAALGAYLTVGIGPFSHTFERQFASTTLLDFSREAATQNAHPPVLASVQTEVSSLYHRRPDHALLIHVGQAAQLRDYGNLRDSSGTGWFLAPGPLGIGTNVLASSAVAADPQLFIGGKCVEIFASTSNMPGIYANGAIGGAFSVPLKQALRYHGGAGVDIVLSGSGADNLQGGDGDDDLSGGDGADQLFGAGGRDRLSGQGGNDTLFGGDGDDQLIGDAHGHDYFFGDAGVDTLSFAESPVALSITVKLDAKGRSSGTTENGDHFYSIEHFVGSHFNDTFNGSKADDNFEGNLGDDVMTGGAGNDYLEGGPGADKINGGDILGANGSDTVSYRHSPAAVRVQFALGQFVGGDAEGDVVLNVQNIEGSAFNDTLSGNGQDNGIFGGDGNDLIYGATAFGGGGHDLLVGGRGADTIYADADDVLSWQDADGPVFIRQADNLAQVANADGSTDIDTIYSGRQFLLTNFGDYFEGGAGDERISPGLSREVAVTPGATAGASGYDAINGGGGDDTLVIDYSVGDGLYHLSGTTMFENRQNGQFNLKRSIDGVVLDEVAFSQIEHLIFTGGRENDDVRGLAGADTIHGGGGDDIIGGYRFGDTAEGNGGGDSLYGDDGNDVLLASYSYPTGGNVGIYMDGGAGYDTAYVDLSRTSQPVVMSQGVINAGDFVVLHTNVEIFQIYGGSKNDLLVGDRVDDFLLGGGGDDRIIGEGGNDSLHGGPGGDYISGGIGNDSLYGDDGPDSLAGDEGNDIMYGGVGDDIFYISTGQDQIFGGPDYDRLSFDGTYSKGPVVLNATQLSFNLISTKSLIGLQVTTFSEIEAFHVTGSMYADSLMGGPSADYLDGAGGHDLLFGGAGNDELYGQAGNDILSGGPGDDRMEGGTGDDTYYVEDEGDAVYEGFQGGSDTVNSSLPSYTMPIFVETLYLFPGAVNGVGNFRNNKIIGNGANNILDGGSAGLDTLVGAGGDDIYKIADSHTVVTEKLGEGYDSVYAIVDYVLAANVEKLVLEGGAHYGTGNSLDNVISGNHLNNVLNGGAGNDILRGFTQRLHESTDPGERDIFIGGAGADTIDLENSNGEVFYDDGAAGPGYGDFAVLKDFDAKRDKIKLPGSAADYHLAKIFFNDVLLKVDAVTPAHKANNYGLFIDSNHDGAHDVGDELIAVLPNKPFDLEMVFDHGPDI